MTNIVIAYADQKPIVLNYGTLKGDKGEQGVQGYKGLSAYEVWIAQGNVGTESDYIASLKGEKGDQGDVSLAQLNDLAGPGRTTETVKGIANALDTLMTDYATQRQADNLKVASVEKELTDFQKTLSQVNVNQEAKQSVTGYGTLSLPKNAANGQANATIKGNTVTDENGTKSTVGALRLKSIGKNLFDKSKIKVDLLNQVNSLDIIGDTIRVSTTSAVSYTYAQTKSIQLKPNTTYYISCNSVKTPTDSTCGISVKAGEDIGITLLDRANVKNPSGIFTTTNSGLIKLRFMASGGTGSAGTVAFSSIILSEGSTATPYEPYTESTAYITAKDEDGNIAELRSLPNGTKDEVRDGQHIKRNNIKILQASDIDGIINYPDQGITIIQTIDLPDYIGGSAGISGNYVLENYPEQSVKVAGEMNSSFVGHSYCHPSISPKKIRIVMAHGTTLDQAKTALAGTTLTYQLATPVEMSIEVSGTLLSNPSGTVYVENAVADAGVYTDKMTILNQGLPIKSLEKLIKVDFMTGVETALDIGQAVIAGDKKSFTHPSLVSGDIVFFTYFYDVDGTQGEITITYYDSRHVLKDSVTGKFYKIMPTVANGVLTQELVEV